MNTKVGHPLSEPSISQKQYVSPIIYVAIGTTLLVSLLPNIIWQELMGSSSAWLLWAKLALLGLLILGSTLWKAIRPLRNYFIILAVLYAAEWFAGLISETPQWKHWFSNTPFTANMFGNQLLRLLVAIIIIAALLVIKRWRSQFFLVIGHTSAPVEPIRWLGINGPISWMRFGMIAGICISLGTLAFLLMSGAPSGNTLLKVLPMLPMIIIFAGMNAFSEEMNYRAALLAALNGAVGQQQAILLSAAFFGIGHFYGVPYGILGVAMAGFLGWLLGKAMLETKGFFWPWLIHFLQDVLIFSFMAIGSVVAGGR